MKLEARIKVALDCLQREYPDGPPQAMIDGVVADVTHEYRQEFGQRLAAAATRGVRALRRTLSALAAAPERSVASEAAALGMAPARVRRSEALWD